MTAIEFIDTCHEFARVTAPYSRISDEEHYKEALNLVENLLEEAEDSPDDPLNAIIEMLGCAIEAYENADKGLMEFTSGAMSRPVDVAVLRLLMDQHELGTSDLPEIGSKSMVSRVLSGERSLSKRHIQALSKRFAVDSGLFFEPVTPTRRGG